MSNSQSDGTMLAGLSVVPDSSIPIDIAGNAREAGAYEFVTEEFFIEENQPDPVYVRQIWAEADDRYVPLRCRRVYRSPAGTDVVKTYHVIGKYIPNPTEAGSNQYVRISHAPRRFQFPLDRIQPLRTLWAPWDKDKDPVEFANNTPPAELEFGPWVVEQMRAIRKYFDSTIAIETEADGEAHTKQVETTRDKLNQILHAEANRDEQMMAAAKEEARYRTRHNWQQFKRAAEEGRWTVPPPAAKPFVDLGKKG